MGFSDSCRNNLPARQVIDISFLSEICRIEALKINWVSWCWVFDRLTKCHVPCLFTFHSSLVSMIYTSYFIGKEMYQERLSNLSVMFGSKSLSFSRSCKNM